MLMRLFVFVRFFIAGFVLAISLKATANDTLVSPPILFTPERASVYIQDILQNKDMWKEEGLPLRVSLQRLLDHYTEPFDSVKTRLESVELSSTDFAVTELEHNDTLPLKWLNDSTFIPLSKPLEREPFQITEIIVPVSASILPDEEDEIDEPHAGPLRYDTLRVAVIDTLFLQNNNITLHRRKGNSIIPALTSDSEKFRFLPDSSALIISHSSSAILGYPGSPFHQIPNMKMPDSLNIAMQTLLQYTENRDSMMIFLGNIDGRKTPFWLTVQDQEMQRFWVKNHTNDSITLWIAVPNRNSLMLVLEENVNVERRTKRSASHIPLSTLRPASTLLQLKPLDEIPILWRYGLASSLTVNQTYFSYWARGGESSLATTLDIRANADYINRQKRSRWNNEFRMRYGSISIDEYKNFRTNTDIVEFNSQYNSRLRERLDLSSSFYFKTQIAKGYRNPRDTVVVSKFLNPGTFTLGLGVEYQPHKDTRINFSPLSFRNTFVLDTIAINQRLHGIEAGTKSRKEMGGQLVIRNRVNVTEGLNVTNNVRLFSAYLEKPQNVDVDWEINIEKQFNWYFMVRLNIHMIYDDDVLFTIEDADGNPVKLPDGSNKRVPKLQLKQILGLTLAFKI